MILGGGPLQFCITHSSKTSMIIFPWLVCLTNLSPHPTCPRPHWALSTLGKETAENVETLGRCHLSSRAARFTTNVEICRIKTLITSKTDCFINTSHCLENWLFPLEMSHDEWLIEGDGLKLTVSGTIHGVEEGELKSWTHSSKLATSITWHHVGVLHNPMHPLPEAAPELQIRLALD